MRETYSIPALAQTAEPEALEAWMGSAEPRDRILVAEGRVKPQSALAWMVAANWERLHLVTIVAEARDGGGYRWIAERSGAAAEAASASVSRVVRGGRTRRRSVHVALDDRDRAATRTRHRHPRRAA